MRICFLTDINELGGGEVWVLRAGHILRELGHTVAVAAPLRSPLHQAACAAKFELFCYDRSAGSPFYAPFLHFLKRQQIDVLYCTLIGKFLEAAVLRNMARQINRMDGRRPLIVILKTGLPPLPAGFPQFYGMSAGEEVRRLHVVSEADAKAFREKYQDDGAASFVEVHREGVDLQLFDPGRFDRAETRRQWNIADEQVAITCLSRLQPAKGQEALLRAAKKLLEGNRPESQRIVVLLAGDGPDRERLEALITELDLGENVRLLGKIGGESVPSLLSASDIVCQPSFQDGLPNALVEAAAMQKPVVASGIAGVPEIVHHGVNGLLIAPGDSAGLAEALRTLIGNPEVREKLGTNARTTVLDRFDIRQNVRTLVARLEQEQREFAKENASPEEEPIRVLFLLNMMRTGGEETEVDLLTQHLDPTRFRTSVMTCYGVPEPSPARERMLQRGVRYDDVAESLPDNEARVAHIVDYIRREKVKLLVASQDPTFAYAAMHRLAPGECALIEHGGIEDEARRIAKDRTSRYIGVSRAITETAFPLMPSVDRPRALTIPSMVDPERFPVSERAALRATFGFSEDETIVLFVGRLDRKKGLEHLVRAAEQIVSAHPGTRFLAVGPPDVFQPDYTTELLQKTEELRASGAWTFLGGREDVPQLMVAGDILVLPSRGEGMSHVIEEAGAAELAVIAFDDGAAREQLVDGRAGILISPENPDSLTSELTRLIENPARRKELGGALRERVLGGSSVQHVCAMWETVLEEAAAELPPEPGLGVHILTPDYVPPFPREIQIQTNTFCNASCVMCPYPTVSKEMTNGRMSPELYTEVLEECGREPGVQRIEPFLMNEPFTDPRMVDLIAQAKRALPRAWITVTSNGSLLRRDVADRLVHSGLDAIWFSFNGATKETYEKIMGISYDTVVANIDYLLQIRPANLHVFTNMIETTLMAPEIDANIRRWQARGVGSGSSVLVNRGGNVKNYDELNYRQPHFKPIRICDLLYHKMYILYNGDVVLCCMDWRRSVIMGNIHEQSLRQIWQGERYRHYRRMHEEGRSEELDLCRTCSFVYN